MHSVTTKQLVAEYFDTVDFNYKYCAIATVLKGQNAKDLLRSPVKGRTTRANIKEQIREAKKRLTSSRAGVEVAG